MEAAVEFLGLFPEAHAWNVSILSTDKRAVVYRPSCSRDFLRQNLQTWLSLHNNNPELSCAKLAAVPLPSLACSNPESAI